MRPTHLAGLLAAGVILAACGGGNEENRTPAAISLVSGDNQTGGAGQPLPLPLAVRVDDNRGDPASGVTVTFAVTAGGGTVQATSATTNAQGLASTSWTVGTTAGAVNTATAAVTGLTGSPVGFTATVVAGAVSSLVFVQGTNQSAEVGQTLAQALVVEARDAFNNPVANQAVAWSVTGGGGNVPQPNAVTDAQGQASSTWTLGLEFGPGHALRAQVGAVLATANATATLGAGSTLAIVSGDNQTGVAGAQLATPLGVRVQTAGAQNVAKVPVDWAVASGGGSVSQATTETDANGIATVSWTLGPGGGAQTVTATNATLTPTTVTLTANAVVPPPSSITGTVTLADSLLSAIRASRLAFQRSATLTRTRGRVDLPARMRPRRSRGPEYIAGELLVRFKPGAVSAPAGVRAKSVVSTSQAVGQAMRSRLAAHAATGKVAVTGVSPVILTARIKVAEAAKVDSVARALALDPAVESVGRNGRLRTFGPVRPGTIPNDPFFPLQSWHYSMIDLPRTWSTTTGSAGIIVAVLDNGIVFHHPSIGEPGATYLTGGGNLRNDGYDFVHVSTAALCASEGGGAIDNAGDGDGGYDPDPSTPDDRDPEQGTGLPCARSELGSHGTHVAGTLGAKGNDGANITGANWTVGIRPVRVLGIDGGDYFDIAQGVLYAAGLPADDGSGGVLTPPALPARIINMSLGGGCIIGPDPLHDAIQTVTDPNLPNGGTLVVVAAGNEGSSQAPCPAAYPEVIAVGAVDANGARAPYSNFGSFVDIAAPGGDFPSPTDGSFGIASATCDFTAFPTACTPNLAFYIGTSQATPHVAGVAALLLANNSGLTPAQLRTRLLTYATPISPALQLGSGIVNARNALTQTNGPSRQLFVRAVDAATGATVATTPATAGAPYALNSLADGSYFVVAGEDESGDGEIGMPGRRFGAFGGVSSPTAVNVSGAAGGYAPFTAGFPVEEEANNTAASANRLVVPGAAQGTLTATDAADVYRVQIPTAGTYTFETTGISGAFCGFALDVDTVLELLDAGESVLGTSVDIDTNARNFCSRITQVLNPGTYYLRVTRDLISGIPHTGRYILQARTGP